MTRLALEFAGFAVAAVVLVAVAPLARPPFAVFILIPAAVWAIAVVVLNRGRSLSALGLGTAAYVCTYYASSWIIMEFAGTAERCARLPEATGCL